MAPTGMLATGAQTAADARTRTFVSRPSVGCTAKTCSTARHCHSHSRGNVAAGSTGPSVNALVAEPAMHTAPAGAPPTMWAPEDWPSSTRTGWHSLSQPLLWSGSMDDAEQPAAPTSMLSPAWRMMVLSNGSVTRHLEHLTGHKVHVECLEMAEIGENAEGLPAATALIPGPLVQRQVNMSCPQNGAPVPSETLVYASSWWPAAEVDAFLVDKSLPIWKSLSAERMELYRDIRTVTFGSSPHLERMLGQPGPFWGRQYIFWNNQRPLTVIHEVFSPALCKYIGPQTAPTF